jgi:glyoxylase-like metal-dependent hydrolase (beta-lactamase superfamily II)
LVDGALDQRPLDLLLNTHLHSDHCGGNAALQERFDRLVTLIPPGEAAPIQSWNEEKLSYVATGQICPRFEFDGLLASGSQIVLADVAWEIHGAPGHDPHSVILFEPISRTLISADALWQNGFGVVFPELNGEPSFEDVALTLNQIEQLAPRQVIPGHGPVFTNLDASLRIARGRLDHFSRHPLKHARYAIKVLMKFVLLERQAMSWCDWNEWIERTPYLITIKERFFPEISLLELTNELLAELSAAGVVNVNEHEVRNL